MGENSQTMLQEGSRYGDQAVSGRRINVTQIIFRSSKQGISDRKWFKRPLTSRKENAVVPKGEESHQCRHG